ncbi:hypothetical protein B0H67DRAFT_580396 [Lasiosphaeris hirsuta]|uniref:Uncharacterized protein n=1 Tax=Lasiosphaeris hirsuta TaxID=260670 RepID=A0AA40DW64_9PEZI|nr:hypothetical protein B0H67DRAFT_580396 [Lasiosphaeris hirsuta]
MSLSTFIAATCSGESVWPWKRANYPPECSSPITKAPAAVVQRYEVPLPALRNNPQTYSKTVKRLPVFRSIVVSI